MEIRKYKDEITNPILKIWSKFLLVFGYKTKYNKFEYHLAFKINYEEYYYLNLNGKLSDNIYINFHSRNEPVLSKSKMSSYVFIINAPRRFKTEFKLISTKENINYLHENLYYKSERNKIRNKILEYNSSKNTKKKIKKKRELNELLKKFNNSL